MAAGQRERNASFPSCSEDPAKVCHPGRTRLDEPTPAMHTVAVDILTGFLGSGKTTLLRHVLDHGLRGKPVAVIMNENGEIGDDGRVGPGMSAVQSEVRPS